MDYSPARFATRGYPAAFLRCAVGGQRCRATRNQSQSQVLQGSNKMRLKALSLLAAVSLLAACETAPDAGSAGSGTATATTTTAPASTGVRDGSQEQLRAQAGDRVYFAYDKSDITPESRR